MASPPADVTDDDEDDAEPPTGAETDGVSMAMAAGAPLLTAKSDTQWAKRLNPFTNSSVW